MVCGGGEEQSLAAVHSRPCLNAAELIRLRALIRTRRIDHRVIALTAVKMVGVARWSSCA
jgi:hypothetical protein